MDIKKATQYEQAVENRFIIKRIVKTATIASITIIAAIAFSILSNYIPPISLAIGSVFAFTGLVPSVLLPSLSIIFSCLLIIPTILFAVALSFKIKDEKDNSSMYEALTQVKPKIIEALIEILEDEKKNETIFFEEIDEKDCDLSTIIKKEKCIKILKDKKKGSQILDWLQDKQNQELITTIESLNLNDLNLKEIPPLTNFSRLTHLQLNNNSITEIKTENLPFDIQSLSLQHNNIHTINKWIRTVLCLETLLLQNNPIKEITSLDNFQPLYKLSLTLNKDLKITASTKKLLLNRDYTNPYTSIDYLLLYDKDNSIITEIEAKRIAINKIPLLDESSLPKKN